MPQHWIESVAFDANGLIPAIAQDHLSGKVLMVAWMNQQALALTVAEQRAVYFSRSRQTLWRKGEQSGHIQKLIELRMDCDADVILLQVEQIGGIACHTGRHNCFYQKLDNGAWKCVDPVIKSSEEIYGE